VRKEKLISVTDETGYKTKGGMKMKSGKKREKKSLKKRNCRGKIKTNNLDKKKPDNRYAYKDSWMFKKIADDANYGTTLTDLEGNILYINKYCLKIHGYEGKREEVKNISTFHTEDQMKYVRKLYAKLVKNGKFNAKEIWHVKKDGTAFPMLVNGTVIYDESNNPYCISFTAIDISDRKRIETLFSSFFALNPVPIVISSYPESRLLNANEAFFRLTGYPAEKIIGLDIKKLNLLVNTSERNEIMKYLESHDSITNRETKIFDSTGSIKTLLFSTKKLKFHNETVLITAVLDTTELKKAENLIKSEKKFRELAEFLPNCIFETDLEGYINYMNIAGLKLFDFSKGIFEEKIKIFDLISDKDKERFKDRFIKLLRGGESMSEEFKGKKKDGSLFPITIHSSAIKKNDWTSSEGVRGLLYDLSHQKKIDEEKQVLQRQLLHADRLSTIGQLAAGIAHEINEPLSSILGFAQLAKKHELIPEEVTDDLEKIINASLHARTIIKHLLTFAKQVSPQKSLINLNRLVNDSLCFLENRCRKNDISISRALSSDLPEFVADPTQINQLLVNLVVNAINAMIPGGGQLIIKTYLDGKRITLVVEDSGEGMDKDTLEKIFNPFFTTGRAGEGTGLGLSVVHGIVNSHNGSIKVYSHPGRGTKFEIRLPVLTEKGLKEYRNETTTRY